MLRWIAVVLIVAAVGQEVAGRYYDAKLSAAVQEATGRPELTVKCRRVWDELTDIKANPGFVYWGSDEALLSFPICMDASRWADNPTDTDARIGLMILTHETAHLVGHINESETECVAMWAAPNLATALGGTVDDAEATARWYAAEYNPMLRADYRAPGCLSQGRPASPLLR